MRKKKTRWGMAALLLLAAAPALSLSAPQVAFENGLLTVQARNLPLKQILQQLADQTGAEITVEGTADNAVSADFTETDFAAALLRIAPDFNTIVLYGGAGPQGRTSVSAIRLYAISTGKQSGDVITIRPKTAGK
jgi:type II secretory pathway component GspD/PulD (secretin)